MIVKELIEELQKYPPDARIEFVGYGEFKVLKSRAYSKIQVEIRGEVQKVVSIKYEGRR